MLGGNRIILVISITWVTSAAILLTPNYCRQSPSLTLQFDRNSDVIENTNFVETLQKLIYDHQSLPALPTFTQPQLNGDIRLMMGSLQDCDLYSRPVSTLDLKQLSGSDDPTAINFVRVIFSDGEGFCVAENTRINLTACNTELISLATLTEKQYSIPTNNFVGPTKYNPFNLDGAQSSILTLTNQMLKFETPDQIMCEVNEMFSLSLLRDDIENLIQINLNELFTVIFALSTVQLPVSTVCTNNPLLASTFNGFENHSHHLFSILSGKNIFPKYFYDASCQTPFDTSHLPYYMLIKILTRTQKVSDSILTNPTHQRVRRGILKIFGDDESTAELKRNSVIFSKNFAIVNERETSLRNNQRAIFKKQTILERNLLLEQSAISTLSLELDNLNLDLTLFKKQMYRESRFVFLSNALHSQFLLQTQVLQQTELTLEKFYSTGKNKCTNDGLNVYCANNRPIYILNHFDVHVIYNASVLKPTTEYMLQCLPKPSTNIRFKGHNQLFHRTDNVFSSLSTELHFNKVCLTEKVPSLSCQHMYENVEDNPILGSCYYIIVIDEMSIICHNLTKVTDRNGSEIVLSDTPKTVKLTQLPLTSDTHTFNTTNIASIHGYTIPTHSHFTSNHGLLHSRSTYIKQFTPIIGKDNITMEDDTFIDFFTPEEPTTGHYISLTLVVIIGIMLIGILIYCGRYPHVRSLYKRIACSPFHAVGTLFSLLKTCLCPSQPHTSDNRQDNDNADNINQQQGLLLGHGASAPPAQDTRDQHPPYVQTQDTTAQQSSHDQTRAVDPLTGRSGYPGVNLSNDPYPQYSGAPHHSLLARLSPTDTRNQNLSQQSSEASKSQ